MKSSIGSCPFAGKSIRETGVTLRPLTVRHGNVLVTAAPSMGGDEEHGLCFRIAIHSGTRGELLDTLEGSGFHSAEACVQAAEQALARWQLLGELGNDSDEEQPRLTARERSLALRFKLHGY
jgi:hypothetical protein